MLVLFPLGNFAAVWKPGTEQGKTGCTGRVDWSYWPVELNGSGWAVCGFTYKSSLSDFSRKHRCLSGNRVLGHRICNSNEDPQRQLHAGEHQVIPAPRALLGEASVSRECCPRAVSTGVVMTGGDAPFVEAVGLLSVGVSAVSGTCLSGGG